MTEEEEKKVITILEKHNIPYNKEKKTVSSKHFTAKAWGEILEIRNPDIHKTK